MADSFKHNFEASYIGHLARNLWLPGCHADRNIVDPKSGQDWYTAARTLERFE